MYDVHIILLHVQSCDYSPILSKEQDTAKMEKRITTRQQSVIGFIVVKMQQKQSLKQIILGRARDCILKFVIT